MALIETHHQPLRPEGRQDYVGHPGYPDHRDLDETIVASGDRHDLGIETLCIGEAA